MLVTGFVRVRITSHRLISVTVTRLAREYKRGLLVSPFALDIDSRLYQVILSNVSL